MTWHGHRIMTSVPQKHIGSALQSAGGQWTERRTQGIPLRGLVVKWTCEAGGSLLRASGCLLAAREVQTWLRPHAAVTDNIITAATQSPRRAPQDIPLSSSYSLHFQVLTATFRWRFFLELRYKTLLGKWQKKTQHYIVKNLQPTWHIRVWDHTVSRKVSELQQLCLAVLKTYISTPDSTSVYVNSFSI